MIVVAKDGSGDFTGIQAAVDALPEAPGRSPSLILVRAGEYREKVVIHRDHVRLLGEDRDRTVLVWNGCANDQYEDGTVKGTFLSATLMTTGRNIEVENLTVCNDAGDGRDVGQAVAVYAAGDRGVWRNCRFIAHQDTLFCGPVRLPNTLEDILPRRGSAETSIRVEGGPLTSGRQYFEDCFIRGDVDFIFGSYRCWFERCTLFMNARGGFYTAANTNRALPFGFVFHRCRLTGECGEGEGFLGRPWRKYARTLFLECDMDEHVAPEGFCDWDADRVVTDRYGEWRTTGIRADQSTRHPAQKRLTDEEALLITLPQVLGGTDGWQPDRLIPTWFLCGDSIMADYPPESAPMTGWGQVLQAFVSDPVFIQNEAVNGRSTRSFIDEGRLDRIALCLRPGDRLLIGFGHNDEKQEDPARYTTPDQSFPENLSRFIQIAEAHGALPILMTPVVRRRFDESGRLTPTHGDYPAAIRKLAAERGLSLVDLEKATAALVENEGTEGSRRFYCHLPKGHPNYPDGLEDNSHLSLAGAVRIAQLFAALLQKSLDSASVS